jgi:hypothetical protein
MRSSMVLDAVSASIGFFRSEAHKEISEAMMWLRRPAAMSFILLVEK